MVIILFIIIIISISSIIGIIIHLLTVDRIKSSTIQKIYTAVTIPITDNDGTF